jgi:hypothetical protein
LGGDEDGGLAGLVGNGDFDEGVHIVLLAALEAQAAFGHVLAGDDVVSALGNADAGGAADLDARMLAAIDGQGDGCGGFFGSGGRQGEDSGRRLFDRAGASAGRITRRLSNRVADKGGAGGVKVG